MNSFAFNELNELHENRKDVKKVMQRLKEGASQFALEHDPDLGRIARLYFENQDLVDADSRFSFEGEPDTSDRVPPTTGKFSFVFHGNDVMEIFRAKYNEERLREALATAIKADYKRRNGKGSPFSDIYREEDMNQGTKLLAKPFCYKLLPDCVKCECVGYVTDKTYSQCSREIIDVKVMESAERQKRDEKELRDVHWFIRFIDYCAGSVDLGIPRHDVQMAITKLSDKEAGGRKALQGIHDVAEQMRESFQLFETTETLPRGVLLYGPPGTGKTTIITRICELLDIYLVSPMLAAGDFAKPLVGQSEMMINQLAERAELLPWRLCAVVVDEIESLVESREGSGNGGGASKLSVLLSRIGGVSDVPNLMFFAATNHPEKMDSAFMRRMKIKLFIGPPTRSGRADYIDHNAQEFLRPDDLQHKCPGDTRCADKGCLLKRAVVMMTVNFATAHINGALLRIRGVLTKTSLGSNGSTALVSSLEADRFVLVQESLERYCEQEGLFMLPYNQARLLGPILRHQDPFSARISAASEFFQLFDTSSAVSKSCTGLILVDLGADAEHVQVKLVLRQLSHNQRRLFTERNTQCLGDPVHIEVLCDMLGAPTDLEPTIELLKSAFLEEQEIQNPVNELVALWQLSQELHKAYKSIHDKKSCPNEQAFLKLYPRLWHGAHAPFSLKQVTGMFRSERKTDAEVRSQWNSEMPDFQVLNGLLDLKLKNQGKFVHDKLRSMYQDTSQNVELLNFSLLGSSSVSDVVTIACKVAWVANVTRLLLINRQTFYEQGAANQEAMILYLHRQIESIRNHYKTAIVVFDLDSIATPRRGPSGAFELENEALVSVMLLSMKNLPSAPWIWCFAVCSHSEVAQRFSDFHSWPRILRSEKEKRKTLPIN